MDGVGDDIYLPGGLQLICGSYPEQSGRGAGAANNMDFIIQMQLSDTRALRSLCSAQH
jgi:hypothetical protein